jgi:hypothetical protein
MTLLPETRSNPPNLTRDLGMVNFNPKSKIQDPKSLISYADKTS